MRWPGKTKHIYFNSVSIQHLSYYAKNSTQTGTQTKA